jgi:Family of unknown function (DUF6073)
MADFAATEMRPFGKEVWGRALNPIGPALLFKNSGAPRRHVRGVHPPAGIDHMRLRTTDVFRVPNVGTFTVEFGGYFKVLRSDPDVPDFNKATVYVNFLDLKLFGAHPQLGDITVDLNPNVLSAGNTYPSAVGVAACAINVAARFNVTGLNKVLFNKTPIQLKNPAVQGIPTIGEGGDAYVNALPLYDFAQPNGDLLGYVEELQYQVLDYATKDEVSLFVAAKSLTELRSLAATQNVRLQGI